jgi:hypothetical protein
LNNSRAFLLFLLFFPQYFIGMTINVFRQPASVA